MIFPKPLMTIKELIPMGFSDDELRSIARTAGAKVIVRPTAGKTARLLFDTDELSKYLARQSRMWENAHR